jgi:peroxiredoxin
MKTFLVIAIILLSTGVNSFAQETRKAEDAKGLGVGQKAPDFTAIDADSVEFSLATEIKKGPLVLIFYRGFWCPVCNKHLSTIQDSLQLITKKGVTVVAVSPEKPEYLEKMEKKTGAKFRLLYDEGYKISNAYDVTFTPESKQIFVYNTLLGAKLKKTHSDNSQRLPIPATYIIDTNGKIIWRQFDPDYKNRSTVKEIIQNLPQ